MLNYPNNPTGAQAPLAFFEQAVKLAVEHDFVVVHDFAYAGLGVEEQQHSLLEVVAHNAGRVAGAGVHGGDLLALEDVCDGGMACRIHRR